MNAKMFILKSEGERRYATNQTSHMQIIITVYWLTWRFAEAEQKNLDDQWEEKSDLRSSCHLVLDTW